MPEAQHPLAPAAAASRKAARSFLASTVFFRILTTAGILVLWFWTQSLIGARPAPAARIDDQLHDLTAGLNAYFLQNPVLADALLIVSSLVIDALGIFLLGRWIFGRTVRPVLGLALLMLLRQMVEALVLLPAPPHMIWHYPGFPSLLVTYAVSNDFFFSGHSAIAVFGALELARLKRPALTAAALLIIVFELATVIVLRAHYTMDVVTGILAALCVSEVAERLSAPLDGLAARHL
jgi:hypothetical protein